MKEEFIITDYTDEVVSKLEKMGYEKFMWSDFPDHGNGLWLVVIPDDKTLTDHCHSSRNETCPIFTSDEFLKQ